MNKALLAPLVCAFLLTSCGKDKEAESPQAKPGTPVVAAEERLLNIYHWPDYIAKDMVSNFEQETGIKVNYQTFENNEGLQAKLIAGNTGYDIVVPGAVFAKSQIEAGLLMKLDKARIPNLVNLDPAIMAKLNQVDPGNEYLVPWAWSFTTVGINRTKVIPALGNMPLPEDAWELVFNPAYTSRLKSCGIAFLDSPTEILPPALHHIGKDAYSANPDDHKAAGEMLAKVRDDIRFFSSTMIDDIASGKACVVIGWAGDINIARARAIENQNGYDIEALIPKSGAPIFFDNLAIPKDARHPGNAMAFINYFLRPEVSAALTNELNYPTANKESVGQVRAEVARNPSVFLDAEALKVMVSPSSLSNAARASMTAVYSRFKQGKQ